MKKAVDGGQPFLATRAAPPPLLGRSFARFFVRQWAVHPSDAVAAFDDWRRCCECVVAPAGRLTLGPSLPSPRRTVARADEPLRSVRGRLHPARWIVTASVELAVVAWSEEVTELDLRPWGRAQRALRMPASVYFAAGNAVVDVVLAELRARTTSAGPEREGSPSG